MSENNVKLATFEQVLSSQRDLRHKLSDLIEENRWLEGEDERDRYYSLVGWALHGVGDRDEYESNWKGDVGEVFFQTYQRFIQKAGLIDEDYVLKDDRGKPILADPEKVWKNVREDFLDKIGTAQREAFQQSPEKEQRNPPKTKTY